MAISSVAVKPDGSGGEYRLYMHEDHTAELRHRPVPGRPDRPLVGRQMLADVRRRMSEMGISEEGWSPD